MNTIFGRFFRVDADEILEPAAVAEKTPRMFIFDVQTHHVAMPFQVPNPDRDFLNFLVGTRQAAGQVNPAIRRPAQLEDLYIENFIKEVFLDSEVDVVALSALPGTSEESDVLSPEVIYKSRSWVNELTSSTRVISHGYFSPDLGRQNLEYMDAQLGKLKIDAWKGYTGTPRAKGTQFWRMDDEKVTFPALEFVRKRGTKNICLHKGLPLPVPKSEPDWWSPMDVPRAALAFPDLNFLVYHSGFRSVEETLPLAQDGFKKSAYIPWTSDICAWKKKNPKVRNVYMELGSTFALMVSAHPMLAAHVLGMMIDAFGDDHVLWGTDSIWWGSPQWQIEAFRRLEMPEDLTKRFGWKPLTDDVKRKIFGLNAARLYGVDPQAKVNPIPGDYLDRLRQLYKQSRMTARSNTQYGWVRADSLARAGW
jgi:predicted TIM-barrel fold metal-dependent hydrolase